MTTQFEMSSDLPLACERDAGAFSPEQESRYAALRQEMEAAILEIAERPDGYALRFAAGPATILALAEFITLERSCCPFFRFALEIEPGDGPLWLQLGGGAGVKEFLRAELGLDGA